VGAQLDLELWRPPAPPRAPGRRSRADQVLEAFVAFHRRNPSVWILFDRFALEAASGGRLRYSADAILHRIRWHVDIETNDPDGLKINDHFSAYYARLWQRAHPERAGFFRNRELPSRSKPAAEHDRQAFLGGPPADEGRIVWVLDELLR
jgi:hypothetical protein